MSTRLTLIAHAPTTAIRAAAFPSDESLDERGLAMAHSAAIALAGGLQDCRRAWTSPARGAVETARALGLDAASENSIADADYGRWSGRTFDEVAADEPAALAAWMRDPTATPHGGESIATLLARVGAWLDARCGERGHAAAVTHAAVVRAAIVHAIGAPPASFWHIDVEPLSRTELRPNGARWTLRAIDRGVA